MQGNLRRRRPPTRGHPCCLAAACVRRLHRRASDRSNTHSMCWRTSFTSAPTISAAPSSNRSAFHWTATTSTDASSAPRRCWQIRVRRRPTSRSSWASAKRARFGGVPTHDWDHSNRLPPHPGMKPRPRRNGGLNPRSSISPGLSMWRVDTKRGVSYSTPMSARPIRLEGLAAGLAEHLTRH
jgi:hypothetical protein